MTDDRLTIGLSALGPMEVGLRKESTQKAHDGQEEIKPPNGLVIPPANLSALARLSRVNSTRRSIIEAVTRNTVALGFEVEPKETRPEMPKPQEKKPDPIAASPISGVTPPGTPNLPAPAAQAAKVPGAAPAAQAGAPMPVAPPEEPAEPVMVEPTEEAKASARAAQRSFDAKLKLDELAAKDIASDSPTFLGLLAMVKTDEEECGNGAIEVSRNRETGEIDGLYYAPGARVRRNYDRDGYAIVAEFDEDNEDRIVRYANFGTRTDENGWLDHTILPRGGVGPEPDRGQNELLVFRLMANSESRDYGLPRDVAMVDDYVADRNAAGVNVEFFGNSGVPPTIIFFNGEINTTGPAVTLDVPDDLVKKVAATLRAGADSFQSRVGLVPLPPGQKPTAINLAQDSARDVGYVKFRDDVTSRSLMAFRVQPIFIAKQGESVGTTDPEVQRALTLEQVFDPEQQRYERRLTQTILPAIGFDDMEIKLKRMAVEDAATARESSERSAEVGTITNAEFRDAHGRNRLPEDGVKVEEGWNDSLIKPKGAGAAASGTPTPTPPVNANEDQRGKNPTTGGRVARGTENPEHARNLSVAKAHADDHGVPTHVTTVAGITTGSIMDLHQQRLDAAFPDR